MRRLTLCAGADVAYHPTTHLAIAALVVLHPETCEILDQAVHEMPVTAPYVPGKFYLREVPPLIEAYRKLTILPDLIIADGHGLAHPTGLGMATVLGRELDVPTIGCAKNRLVGHHEPVGPRRGDYAPLLFEGKEIGRVLRTQDGIKPLFISIGHRVTLDEACDWVLKMAPQYRQPETTRAADALVRKIMKERTDALGHSPK